MFPGVWEGADEMEVFRISVSAALMGWSPLVKAWWGRGLNGFQSG